MFDRFDIMEALYLYYTDWHNGQWSREYKRLCHMQKYFKPSFYFLGLSCLPIALMSLLNIFYSFYFNYLKNLNSYLAVLVISITISISLIKIGKKDKDKISIYGQLFLIFLIYFSQPK